MLIVSFVITIVGCTSQEADPAIMSESNSTAETDKFKNTPVRVSAEGTLFESHAKNFTLDMLVEESDIIADVTIVEWLGECNDINDTFLD